MEGLILALNAGIADTVGDLTGIVTGNVGVILGLVAVTIGLPFGINLLRKFAH